MNTKTKLPEPKAWGAPPGVAHGFTADQMHAYADACVQQALTRPAAPDAVRGLVEKWRNDPVKDGDKHWGEFTTERYHVRGQAAARKACADELESALAAPACNKFQQPSDGGIMDGSNRTTGGWIGQP